MKWINRKSNKDWVNEGKQLIKDWQKQQKQLKKKDKQIKLEL